ncbi:hypothetical protein [Pseudonocardia broussonetiae]|uniref:Uncharacterized protein n=1 Tax=Pseudonocardia broussonetiae TaxID=2736640 RepID=A0A6M6JID7_9PSEU|nr:hypothetical protein [Pseudonocardia broussonetiae]QJY46677.1 hypothetical protein HOP40_13310 [Pseudonocardia broussonetiae]
MTDQPSTSRGGAKVSGGTCPNGTCPHVLWLHDIVEAPGPPVQVCTVFDCPCRGTS